MQINLVRNNRFLSLKEIEGEAVRAAVKHCQGNVSLASKQLGIGRSTMYRLNDVHKVF